MKTLKESSFDSPHKLAKFVNDNSIKREDILIITSIGYYGGGTYHYLYYYV